MEDDEFTSQLLTFLLEREKYTVHLAKDGHAAQAFITSHDPTTVALLDVMLPFLDGFEVLRMLHAQPDWQKSRVIMLSAKT